MTGTPSSLNRIRPSTNAATTCAKTKCSSANTLAATSSASIPGFTSTCLCATILPLSNSSLTKCTVGPENRDSGRHDSLVHVVTVHAFPAKRGEQRGMYVEHLVFVRAAQLRRDESQVPRE